MRCASRVRVLSFLFLQALLWTYSSQALADAIIIDHRCTDVTRIPQYAIERAKANLHIGYGHTSHGSQVTDGMTGLVAFANGGGKGLSLPADIFLFSSDDQSPERLHLYEGSGLGGDVGYYPDWVNYTQSFLGDPDPSTGRGQTRPDINVIIWSWCGQVDDKYSAGTLDSEYLTPMAQLENQYPGVAFVYMTGHLDHWDDADNKAANQVIRDYCRQNGKVLYDFADIESYDPDGIHYEYAHDSCDYYDENGTLLGNWATEWQNSHTVGVDWYSCGAAHSQPLNANQKAYAAWWLWSRLAGWAGPGSGQFAISLLLNQ